MLSVLIPTKGRPEKLAACVRSIDLYCEILILATRESDIPYQVAYDSRVQLFFDDKMSIIEAQNFLANRSMFDLLPCTDDIKFDYGSLMRAIDLLDMTWSGNGVVSLHVRNMDCADYAYMLVGREFFTGTLKGELFHPGYKHFYADQELSEIAKKAKRYIHSFDATIFNFHPNAGFAEDETHQHERLEKLAHDQDLYDSRILHGKI